VTPPLSAITVQPSVFATSRKYLSRNFNLGLRLNRANGQLYVAYADFGEPVGAVFDMAQFRLWAGRTFLSAISNQIFGPEQNKAIEGRHELGAFCDATCCHWLAVRPRRKMRAKPNVH